MAPITYRCEICSSEILASRRVPSPHVCVLCKLSADEAVGLVEDEACVAPPRYRAPRAVMPGRLGLSTAW